jgi:hypothetical protein
VELADRTPDVWHEPTLVEVAGEAVRFTVYGQNAPRRNEGLLKVLALILLALVLPSVTSGDGALGAWIGFVLISGAASAFSAADRQQRLGRPSPRPAVAGLVAAAVVLAAGSLYTVVSVAFGPDYDTSPVTIVIEQICAALGISMETGAAIFFVVLGAAALLVTLRRVDVNRDSKASALRMQAHIEAQARAAAMARTKRPD